MPLPSKKSSLPDLPEEPLLSKPKLPQRKVQLPEEFEEEEVFTSLTEEEVESYDEFERDDEEEDYNVIIPSEEKVQGKKIPQPNYSSPLEEREPNEEDKFIDKKNKKIIPTGGKKSKAKAKDFDGRKNSLTMLKVFRLFLFIFFVGLFGLGIKNTFFPEQIYTNEEIASIATESIGETGFPMEKGNAFAQEFLYYYVNSDTSDTKNTKILTRFYDGVISEHGSVSGSNKLDQTGTSQKAISAPILVDKQAITESTAVFTYNILVTDTDGQIENEAGEIRAHWMSFAINVYYDKEKDSFTIHKDSPTMVPSYNIKDAGNLPNEQILGNGTAVDPIPEKLASAIDGFIQAYSVSSVDNHSDIDQYIPKNPDVGLISGFGGTVKLFDGKTSIKKAVYQTDEENIYKVNVTVQWQDIQATTNGSVYYSRYVLTIEKQNNDSYLVTKIAPYLFVPEQKTDNS